MYENPQMTLLGMPSVNRTATQNKRILAGIVPLPGGVSQYKKK
jgi:hypothetical protein